MKARKAAGSNTPPAEHRLVWRVLLLWAVILGAFLIFNGVFWPLQRGQDRRAPENFLRYAESLYTPQTSWEAIESLRTGIATFRPAYPEPYTLIRHMLTEAGARDAGLLRTPYVHFYSALCAQGPQREREFGQAIESARRVFFLPEIPEQTAGYVDVLAREFACILETPAVVAGLETSEKLALLYLSGDAIALDGAIGSTGVRSLVDILVMSAGGMREGSGAHIFMRGQDYGSKKRGFHVALANAESGQVMQLGVFDLWESASEAVRMQQFLGAAPEGAIGVFAVSDDASVYLTPALGEVLEGFGLAPKTLEKRVPVFLGLRYSFAAIGVKGAPAGSALQTWSPAAFKDHVGHPVVCGVLRAEGGAQ